MATMRRKFSLGIRLKPNATTATLEGELYANSSSLTFKAYIDGAERDLVTADQTQTLTNKTLTAPTITSGILNTAVSGTAVLDEDNMASDSDTQVATQQSIKAYVDAQVTAQDLDTAADSGTGSIDLDSQSLTVTGGTGIDTTASGQTITAAIDSTVTTLTGSQTLTNKTVTSPVINTGVSGTAVDTDVTLAADSDTLLASQKATKAYVDAQILTTDDASEVTFTPAVLADWDSSLDPGNVDGGLDQLAERVTDNDTLIGTNTTNNTGVVTVHSDVSDAGSGIIISAAERTAISTNTTNNSGVVTVHSDVSDAGSGIIISAAERTAIGTNTTGISDHLADTTDAHDSSAVSYTPAVLADWDSSADPGHTDDALDQLAERITDNDALISTNTSNNAGVVTVHSDVTDAGSGIIISAAERTAIGTNTTNNSGVVTVHSDVSDAGSGIIISAAERTAIGTNTTGISDHLADTTDAHDSSAVSYTPAVLADWDSSADPGHTDDALDQLAERVTDNDALIGTNTSKVTNATHTGDVTGDTALTLGSVAISGQGAATVASTDEILISDVDDSGNLKKVTAQSIADLATGTTDHTALSNIGTKTHATLDSEVDANNAKISVDSMTGDVTASGGATTISALAVDNGMLAGTIDAAKIHDGTVSNTEFGYLNGVTNSIQTQFTAKMTDPMTTNGDIIYENSGPARLAKGSDGEVLTLASGIPSWAAAGGGGSSTVSKSSTGSLATSGEDNIIATSTITLTTPTASGNSGLTYKIVNNGTGVVTVDGYGSETIGSYTDIVLASKSDSIIITSDGTNWHLLSFDVKVVASYGTNSAQTLTISTLKTIDFEDSFEDTHSAVTTGASWKFTAPYDGYYRVSALIYFSSNYWGNNTFGYGEYQKNGTAFAITPRRKVGYFVTDVMSVGGDSVLVQLDAGDYIDFSGYTSAGSYGLYTGDSIHSTIHINKV